MTMRYSWSIFYFALFFYRSFYSYAAQVWILGLTTLGDSSSIQTGNIALQVEDLTNVDYLQNTRGVASDITATLGSIFGSVLGGNAVLINIAFQAIAFVGIVVFLRAAQPRQRIWLAALLMLPSFTIWSSIASKEAIVVFAMGFIGAFVIRLYRGTLRFGVWHLVSILIIVFFKAQYLPAILFILVGTIICSGVKKKAFVALVGGFLSLMPLYFFRDTIDLIALDLPRHFSTFSSTAAGNVSSTREAYWVSQYDVFWKAPYGMFQAFFGPTIAETSRSVLQLASFLESALIILVLTLYSLRQFFRLPAYSVVMAAFTLFWILFATYPPSMMNAGTAIRYRTGYEILVFLVVVVLLSRETYVGWRGGSKTRNLETTGDAGRA